METRYQARLVAGKHRTPAGGSWRSRAQSNVVRICEEIQGWEGHNEKGRAIHPGRAGSPVLQGGEG